MKTINKFMALVILLLLAGSVVGCSDNSDMTPTLPPTGSAIQTSSPDMTEQGTENVTQSGKDTEIDLPPQTTTPYDTVITQDPQTEIQPTEIPLSIYSISTFNDLTLLIGSGNLKEGDTVKLVSDMVITSAVKIYKPISFSIEGNIKCDYPIEVINIGGSGECFVDVFEGVDASSLDLRYDTPNCSLTWNGTSPYQTEEAIAEVMNVKSYNGVDLMAKHKMGGDSWKKVAAFEVTVKDNPTLKENLSWRIDGNVAYLALSYMTDLAPLKNAVVRIEMSDGSVVNEIMDLTKKQQIYTLTDCAGDKRGYKVVTEIIEYNLPVVYIWIEDSKEVTSKEEYLSATISISAADSAYGSFNDLSEREVLIRGRGHFTWQFDKKPYKIRFDSKTPVLGMNPSKNWVLLANYVDRSLIQNYVAMEMGKVMTNLPYHSNQYPVDVFVNGTYRGVYTIGEQLEAKEERIDLEENYQDPDTDYLIELGGSDEGDVLGRDYFHAGTIKFAAIKHPDSAQLSDEQIAYLKNYVQMADDAVRNLSNYEEYIDVDSLIDWVIMHELTYNLDCCFRRSCYMIKEKGGKLKMGPIWDFDLAFGSYYRYAQGDFATVGESGGYVGITWMNYLIKDKDFMERFSKRWNEIKDCLLKTALDSVDKMSQFVSPSAEMNFKVWDVLGKSIISQPSSHKKYDTYEKMVNRLKEFINDRYNWMDDQLN